MQVFAHFSFGRAETLAPNLFYQLIADVIAELSADVLTPSLRHGDAVGRGFEALHHGVDISGVEVVSGTYGAHGLNRPDRENSTSGGCVEADSLLYSAVRPGCRGYATCGN